ncbi:uncharacterized protein LOC132065594 [Lycium ferocissimum]|uniref:uncharacterized protein LOC132065594 n=1 Tax=Lycium ferocissimum TaxID=112874 RepID=UPI002815FC46|nr:uncharacterized protein LOC132065594 [Lycium ferocissimum]
MKDLEETKFYFGLQIEHLTNDIFVHQSAYTEKVLKRFYMDEAHPLTCIAQLKGGFIKGDRTKHISPKLLFTHELQKKGDINVQQIRSCDNMADLFTTSLPTATFEKVVHKIGIRRLKHMN